MNIRKIKSSKPETRLSSWSESFIFNALKTNDSLKTARSGNRLRVFFILLLFICGWKGKQ